MLIRPIFETTLAEDLQMPGSSILHKKGASVTFNAIIETRRFEKFKITPPDPVGLNLDLAERRMTHVLDLEKTMQLKKNYIVFSHLNNLPNATAKNSLENDPSAIKFREFEDEQLYEYLEECMSAIIHLLTAIETFVNILIPVDYNYIEKKWIFFKRKRNKMFIERHFSIIKKLEIVANIRSLSELKQKSFWPHFRELKSLRDEVVHLKTKGKHLGIGEVYTAVYKQLFDLDLKGSFNQIISLIKYIDPNHLK